MYRIWSGCAARRGGQFTSRIGRSCSGYKVPIESIRSLHEWGPESGDYYLVDTTSDEVLGRPRVESTRLQAAARRITEHLLLGPSTNQALLESEEAAEFGEIGQRSLHDFVDAGERALPRLPSDMTSLPGVNDVAGFIEAHGVRRLGTYHLLMRRLLESGQAQAAQIVLDSLVMTRRRLNLSTLALALEIARTRRDKRLYETYAEMTLEDAPRFNGEGGRSSGGKDVALALAEGGLYFQDSHRLERLIKWVHPNMISLHLLTAIAEASTRLRNRELGMWAWSQFPKFWNSDDANCMQFLRVAANVPWLHGRSMRRVARLSEPRRREFFKYAKFSRNRYRPL